MQMSYAIKLYWNIKTVQFKKRSENAASRQEEETKGELQ